MNIIINKVLNYICKERFTIGPSLARIGLGAVMLSYYLVHYHQRHFLWFNNGLFTNDSFNELFNLYTLSDNIYYFEFIFHFGLLLSLCFLIGFKTRFVSFLNIFFFHSITSRNFFIGDGGDNLLLVCMIYFIFMDMGKRYSLDAYLNKNKIPKSDFKYKLKNTLNNFAVFMCVIQLAILYFVSGSYQIMGDYWNSGVALYYIFQVNEYNRNVFANIILNYPFLLVILTYFSIIIKIAFPFSLFNKRLKLFIVICLIGFHLGIAIEMGLFTFSMIMIIFECFVFSDAEYIKYYNFAKELRIRFKSILFNLFKKERV